MEYKYQIHLKATIPNSRLWSLKVTCKAPKNISRTSKIFKFLIEILCKLSMK